MVERIFTCVNHLEAISNRGTATAHNHEHPQIVLPLSDHLEFDVDNEQRDVQFGQALS